MLGEQAIALAGQCTLRWEDGRTVDTFSEWEGGKQIQYHLRQYISDELPYSVEIHENGKKVSMKYL
jgi:hypothetical protein